MNPKIVLAFVGGLILASGLTYLAVKPSAPVQTAKTAVPDAAQSAPKVEPAPLAPLAPLPSEAPPPAVEPVKPSPAKSWPRAGRNEQRASGQSRPAPRGVRQPAAGTPSAAEPATAPVQTAGNTPAASSSQPASASHSEPASTEPPPYRPPVIDIPPPPNKVVIPSGTVLTVRLSDKLSTEKNQPGDQFSAVLDAPLVVDGFVLAEKGSRAQGRIVELDRGGKVKGLAQLSLELTQIRTSDGQNVKVNTGAFKRTAESSTRRDAAKVGIGAAIGAAIGAIAGGGKGAGIGAGVGGAAGAGDVLLTRGQSAEIPVETRVSFRLSEAVTVTEKGK